MNYLVLDTNVLLLDHNNLLALGSVPDTTIILAETVLEEMDAKKHGLNELAFQSRSFGRLLSKADVLKVEQTDIATESTLKLFGINIIVVTLQKYDIDTSKDSKNDQKIIEVAKYSKRVLGATTLMSNDVMMRLRAIADGLIVADFKEVDKVDYEFTKTLEVTDDTFRNLHGKNIMEIDPDHKVEHYNYKFTTPLSAQMKIASINNETINILGKETEAELRKQSVNPSNADQLLLSRAILDPAMDLIVCEALAGSGKTLVSLSNAMRLVKSNSPYTSIIYIRASINDVEAIEEVGFLPGSAEEKNSVYFHPLYDSLDFIARRKFKASNVKGKELEEKIAEQVKKIIEDCNISTLTGLGMRGRTFNDAVVILDEVQGMSRSSLQKVLTRFGKNCKVVLIGSNNQIDNPNMTKFTNGLSVILNDCANNIGDSINKHVVPLHRVVRSNFAEYAEKLFTKDN